MGHYLVDILFYLWYIESEPTDRFFGDILDGRASNPLNRMEVRKDSYNYLKYKRRVEL